MSRLPQTCALPPPALIPTPYEPTANQMGKELSVRYPARYRPTRTDILVVMVVVLAGLATLPQPFHGDQAVATIMASKISRGATVYRDLWDPKQPGIFGFYLIGGVLFGFN
jgi:hypothetical protein